MPRSFHAIAAAVSAAVLVAAAGAAGADGVGTGGGVSESAPGAVDLWSGQTAMADIAALLQFTPRSLDTPGHQRAIDYIKAALAKTSAQAVTTQSWNYHGSDGVDHALTNVIARFDPTNPRRIILATHYDSIVRAYRDPTDPQGPMPGANNSASGVALLLETARVLSAASPPPFGIDMVFFDGEEGPKSLGAGDPNWVALGSPYFAAHLAGFYPSVKPQQGIVFDMVCDRDLMLNPDPSSISYAKNEVAKFWSVGAQIAPQSFSPTPTRYPIGDDQVALTAAGIPSFLVIDFDYEPWFNTTMDTIDKCSSTSLETVGRTLMTYLYGL
jgi:Zn-dependent M28 family amino/carboxypeptidase